MGGKEMGGRRGMWGGGAARALGAAAVGLGPRRRRRAPARGRTDEWGRAGQGGRARACAGAAGAWGRPVGMDPSVYVEAGRAWHQRRVWDARARAAASQGGAPPTHTGGAGTEAARGLGPRWQRQMKGRDAAGVWRAPLRAGGGGAAPAPARPPGLCTPKLACWHGGGVCEGGRRCQGPGRRGLIERHCCHITTRAGIRNTHRLAAKARARGASFGRPRGGRAVGRFGRAAPDARGAGAGH